MGIFDNLFGKNNKPSPNRPAAVPQNNGAVKNNDPLMSVHPDIRDLIWVGDGKYRNYTPYMEGLKIIFPDGFTIIILFGTEEEPSLLFTSLPVAFTRNPVDRPPYYPTYKGLTPEQKGLYWRFLSNPYDPTVDIGYVFVLYYGLERFLLTKKYEQVIDIILKLRDVHSNKSFQSYSANAIILTCLVRKRPDLLLKFMRSLDKDYELEFSSDLFLLCKHELNLALNAKEIMKIAKSVDFTKRNYIKEYPEMFEEALQEVLMDHYGSKQVLVCNFLPDLGYFEIPAFEISVFANMSISNKSVKVPHLTRSPIFRKNVSDLLNEAHESVKHRLSDMRKSGEIQTVKKEKPVSVSQMELRTFDSAKEAELINTYRSKEENSVSQHFASIELQDFYYGYRDMDDKYLRLCIEYCLDDIKKLPQMQAKYQAEERLKATEFGMVSDHRPFTGGIPAFKRLAIIYEKQKEYDKAIDICDKALQYYYLVGMPSVGDEFTTRKDKLIAKKNKAGGKK